MIRVLPILGSVVKRVLGHITKDKSKIIDAQHEMNMTEISNAPSSHLRLWRSFLGWALALIFVFEVIIRNIIVTYWPNTILPPSTLESVMSILLGMLGLGF